jgi:hypothetical protein
MRTTRFERIACGCNEQAKCHEQKWFEFDDLCFERAALENRIRKLILQFFFGTNLAVILFIERSCIFENYHLCLKLFLGF